MCEMLCDECAGEVPIRPYLRLTLWAIDDALERVFCSPQCMLNYCEDWPKDNNWDRIWPKDKETKPEYCEHCGANSETVLRRIYPEETYVCNHCGTHTISEPKAEEGDTNNV